MAKMAPPLRDDPGDEECHVVVLLRPGRKAIRRSEESPHQALSVLPSMLSYGCHEAFFPKLFVLGVHRDITESCG
jgi:hypothetical protein